MKFRVVTTCSKQLLRIRVIIGILSQLLLNASVPGPATRGRPGQNNMARLYDNWLQLALVGRTLRPTQSMYDCTQHDPWPSPTVPIHLFLCGLLTSHVLSLFDRRPPFIITCGSHFLLETDKWAGGFFNRNFCTLISSFSTLTVHFSSWTMFNEL